MLVQLSQIVVVILFAALIVQVIRLERRHSLELSAATPRQDLTDKGQGIQLDKVVVQQPATKQFVNDFPRAEGLAKAQTFAGIQMLDAKRKGLSIREGRKGDHVKIAAAYLTGASRAITLHLRGGSQTVDDIAAFLITQNLGVTGAKVNALMQEITADEITLLAYRNGLEAAENWISSKFVPEELSLHAVMCNHLFV